MKSPHTQHVPVLPTEVVEQLQPQPGDIVVDGTLGGGGMRDYWPSELALLAKSLASTAIL